MRKLLTVVATLAILAVPSLAQEVEPPQYEEEVDVNLVLIDAIVTNSRGEQILGLDSGDFIVKEGGVVQEIESVDYYTNRRLVTAPEEKAKFDVERIREERYFIFFFDKFPGRAPIEGFDQELWQAIRAAQNFVKDDLLPEDYVAVVGHDARLEIYTDFTRDQSKIIEALNDARRFGSGTFSASEGPSIIEHLDEKAVRNDSGWVWDALGMVGNALQPIRGRKVMYFFSPGFESRSGGLVPLEDHYYEPMVQALNEANTSVYVMNMLEIGDRRISDVNLTQLANDTGGDYYRHPVNYVTPLRRVENINNGYYLITYRTSRQEGETGYQEVEVSLKNPEFRVEAREGYLY